MAATITYASNRVTITGPYKQFTGSSTATVVTFAAGEAPVAGDVGRFVLWCRGGTTLTAQWEVRRITEATATTLTVHDAWGATPSSGDTFRISSTMDDILTAQPSAGSKVGSSSYYINGDFALADRAFLGAADQAVEWLTPSQASAFPCADNTVLQLGQLWGGENGTSTETTNGCRWALNAATPAGGGISLYYASSALSTSGFVFNCYGTLLESGFISGYTGVAGDWLFQRLNGPARFIGSVFDGHVGGRFMHASSEWVQCRHSGNVQLTPAWSIGATFTRPISSVVFYRNLAAIKNYLTFSGVLRGCTFASSNTNVMRVEGSTGSVIDFIDCTEFSDSLISDNGSGVLNQYRSVNLTVQNTSGAAVSGAKVRVSNAAGTTQSSIQATDGSGVAAEILALRRKWTDASPSVTYAPFTTRVRKYGYIFQESSSSISDPIRQVMQLPSDLYVVASEGTASGYTGVTVNGSTLRVSFGAGTVDTFAKLYDYVQYWGQENTIYSVPWARVGTRLNITDGWTVVDPAITGMTWSGGTIEWNTPGAITGSFDSTTFRFNAAGTYDLSGGTFAGTINLTNTSGGGVIVIVLPSGIDYINNDPGSITVQPVVEQAEASVTGIVSGSRIQVYNQTTSTEIANAIVTGTSWSLGYPNGNPFSAGDIVRVRLAWISGATAKLPVQYRTVATASGWSILADQQDDTVYNQNAIHGDTVTEFTEDFPNVEIDINDPDGVTTVQRGYAWYISGQMTADGLRYFHGGMSAEDTVNYRVNVGVVNMKIQNVNVAPVRVIGGRLYRSDGSTVIEPGGGGVQMDYGRAYAVETGVSGLTPAESDRLMQTALQTTAAEAARNAALAAALSA